jgi:hypothetical protein
MSRSASIVLSYLMLTNRELSLMRALHFVKERRPVISPNQGFMAQLVELELLLRKRVSLDLGKYELHGRFGDIKKFAVDGADVDDLGDESDTSSIGSTDEIGPLVLDEYPIGGGFGEVVGGFGDFNTTRNSLEALEISRGAHTALSSARPMPVPPGVKRRVGGGLKGAFGDDDDDPLGAPQCTSAPRGGGRRGAGGGFWS